MNVDPKMKILQANINKLLNERETLKKKNTNLEYAVYIHPRRNFAVFVAKADTF